MLCRPSVRLFRRFLSSFDKDRSIPPLYKKPSNTPWAKYLEGRPPRPKLDQIGKKPITAAPVESKINEDEYETVVEEVLVPFDTKHIEPPKPREPFESYLWNREEEYPLHVPPERLEPDQRNPSGHDGILLPKGDDLTYSIGANYPRLKWMPYSKRSPWVKWDDPARRRNFNDPIHHFDDFEGPYLPDPVDKKQFFSAFWRVSALFAVVFTACWLDEHDPHSHENSMASILYNYPDSEENKRLVQLLNAK